MKCAHVRPPGSLPANPRERGKGLLLGKPSDKKEEGPKKSFKDINDDDINVHEKISNIILDPFV